MGITKIDTPSSSNNSLGVTSPISYDYPTPEEINQNNELKETLKSFNIYENQEELEHRQGILAKLNLLVGDWAKSVAIKKNTPESAAERLGVKIYIFGSYRLGVHNKGADIDGLVIAPIHILRSDFFTSFVELLSKQPEVKECHAVTETFVPILKFNFDGVDIDLLFARLLVQEVPENLNVNDNNLLKHLDMHCVRSLNGWRVNEAILNLVPNITSFQLALRCIKHWAKSKNVYSNSLGYLGGISWAILVARICQLYPNATSSTLVRKFFLVMPKWRWPLPLLLKRTEIDSLGLTAWNPRNNIGDRYGVMPVITPAYPEQNSTYNVSMSSLKVIMEEIKKGYQTIEGIWKNEIKWTKLFEAENFYQKYKHFLKVDVQSSNTEDHKEWSAFMESKIRHLVSCLEKKDHVNIAQINTYPIEIDNTHTIWSIGVDFNKSSGTTTVDFTDNIQNFNDLVERMSNKVKKNGMTFEVKYIKRKDLEEISEKCSGAMVLPAKGNKRRLDDAEKENDNLAKKKRESF